MHDLADMDWSMYVPSSRDRTVHVPRVSWTGEVLRTDTSRNPTNLVTFLDRVGAARFEVWTLQDTQIAQLEMLARYAQDAQTWYAAAGRFAAAHLGEPEKY